MRSKALPNAFFLVGAALLSIYCAAMIHAFAMSRLGVWVYERGSAAEPNRQQAVAVPDLSEPSQGGANLCLWSKRRLRAFRDSVALRFDPPLGVLSIPRVQLAVPIFDSTGSLALNRGVGWIAGTAKPGEDGNVGIAGHRDGFFRGLKDMARGDRIEVRSRSGEDIYEVDRIDIVLPSNVDVLKPRAVAGLTLVTCYPFYWMGDAPRRYIVEASLKEHRVVSGGL